VYLAISDNYYVQVLLSPCRSVNNN